MEVEVSNPNPNGPFDESVYEELRIFLGVDLPDDYLKFLRAVNGGKPTNDSFMVVPGDWGSGIEELYGAQRNDLHSSLLRNLAWPGLELKPGMLAIGADGCFGYILMSLSADDFGSIHFCCT